MKLPSILPSLKKTDPKNENLLSLTLTPHKILTCIWNLSEDEKVNILSFSHKNFTSVDTVINQAAVAIDNAAEAAKTDVSKVVFGLSSYWFEEGKLSQEAAKLLKNMSSDLELDAQAFVSMATAVNHFYKIEHGVTPHAVLLGIFEEGEHSFLETHLIKNNQIEKTHVSKSPINIESISNLIRQLKKEEENLPSKIVIYGSPSATVLESIKNHNWGQTFIHEPKIDHLKEEDIVKAVALAQAADILGHDPIHTVSSTQPPVQKQAQDAGEFGFVAGQDILVAPVEPELPIPLPQPEVTYDNLRPPVLDQNDYAVEINQSAPAPPSKSHHLPIKPRGFKFPLPSLNLINKIPIPKSPKKLAIAAVIVIFALLASVYLAGQTLTNANVVIKVDSHSQEFDFTAKVVSDTPDDFANSQVSGRIVTGSAQGSQKAVSSGSKRIGEKAKGQLIVQNWSKEPKTLPSGTELITNDGLKFTLDSEVVSATGSPHPPGEVKVGATAQDIGSKYNISTSTPDLSIVGYDSYFYSAKVDTAFTGGDEKQVTVASQADLDKLEKTLTDSLKDKAKADLMSKSSGIKIYDEAAIVKVDKKAFDKKPDEEASLINLDMTISINAVAFDENNLKSYLAQLANSKIQGSQEAKPENIEIKDVTVKRQKDTLSISGRFSAGLVPKINEDELKGKIAGKSVKEARAAIMQTKDISDVLVNFSPAIPFIDSIPKNKSKITIKIESS